jgi:excisionase family DNA binding protein
MPVSQKAFVQSIAEKQYLTTIEAAEIAELSPQKIRLLIESGRLPAVDTSIGSKRPRWSIRRVDLEAFLTPASVVKQQAKQATAARRQRIDAHVPKVFG